MSRRIVVTGSAGRIGRYVVRDLRQAGHDVVGIDIVNPSSPDVDMQVDLTDAGQVCGALAGADAVAHIGAWANAGFVPDTRTYGDNVCGTYNVFQACADLGITRIVSASSAQVYGFFGHAPLYAPIDEDHPLRPLNSYATSKIAGEQAAEYFHDRYDLQISSFRFMGVRRPDELPAQIAAIHEDPATDNGLLWTRTDARDAAAACRLALAAQDPPSGVFNITGAEVAVDVDSTELMATHFPDAESRSELVGRQSPLSCVRAEQAFGYRPRFTWSLQQQHPETDSA